MRYSTGKYNYTDFCREYQPGDTAIVAIAGASARPNNTTTTQITINNMTNFGATTLALHYDPTVVHVTSITDGPCQSSSALHSDLTAR
jgi:hypothetical protein